MTNWDAVKTGSLDALMAAIMERMSDQRDDPSSREQEYADTSLSLIERCKAAERALAESEARLAESEARRAESEARRAEADGLAKALAADLARVSEEFDLPPSIGPAPGEIRRMREPVKTYAARAESAERSLAAAVRERDSAESSMVQAQANAAAADDEARSARASLAAAVEVLRPFVDALDGLMFHRAEDGTTTVTGKAVDDFDAWRGFVDALIKVRALAAALAGGSHG